MDVLNGIISPTEWIGSALDDACETDTFAMRRVLDRLEMELELANIERQTKLLRDLQQIPQKMEEQKQRVEEFSKENIVGHVQKELLEVRALFEVVKSNSVLGKVQELSAQRSKLLQEKDRLSNELTWTREVAQFYSSFNSANVEDAQAHFDKLNQMISTLFSEDAFKRSKLNDLRRDLVKLIQSQ